MPGSRESKGQGRLRGEREREREELNPPWHGDFGPSSWETVNSHRLRSTFSAYERRDERAAAAGLDGDSQSQQRLNLTAPSHCLPRPEARGTTRHGASRLYRRRSRPEMAHFSAFFNFRIHKIYTFCIGPNFFLKTFRHIFLVCFEAQHFTNACIHLISEFCKY